MFRFLLIALVLRVGLATTVNDCPYGLGLKQYIKVFGDLCYKFNVNVESNRKDYSDASSDCNKDGGILAIVHSKEVNQFLTTQLIQNFHATKHVWIGLNDIDIEGTYKWEDGSTNLTYSNFADGKGPNNNWVNRKLEDCVALEPLTGKWIDYYCETRWFFKSQDKDYICQYKPRQ